MRRILNKGKQTKEKEKDRAAPFDFLYDMHNYYEQGDYDKFAKAKVHHQMERERLLCVQQKHYIDVCDRVVLSSSSE